MKKTESRLNLDFPEYMILINHKIRIPFELATADELITAINIENCDKVNTELATLLEQPEPNRLFAVFDLIKQLVTYMKWFTVSPELQTLQTFRFRQQLITIFQSFSRENMVNASVSHRFQNGLIYELGTLFRFIELSFLSNCISLEQLNYLLADCMKIVDLLISQDDRGTFKTRLTTYIEEALLTNSPAK